jgi:hypothetical protein
MLSLLFFPRQWATRVDGKQARAGSEIDALQHDSDGPLNIGQRIVDVRELEHAATSACACSVIVEARHLG